MEENVGWEVGGDQKSSWLYKQTRELSEEGVLVVYSGDSPFVMRLILGRTNESVSTSLMPLYIADNEDSPFPPSKTDPRTKKRLDVEVPFRKEIPQTALVHMRDITVVCPDVLHMMIRLVENDLTKVAQLLVNVTHPYVEQPLNVLEQRLSQRDIDKNSSNNHFTFTVEQTTKKTAGKVVAVKLSGREARAILADKSEFIHTGLEIPDLYEGVWTTERFTTTDLPSIDVLKSLGHGHLFADDGTIEYGVLCELLRKSLLDCIVLLRDQHAFKAELFKHAAELCKPSLQTYKISLENAKLLCGCEKSGRVGCCYYHRDHTTQHSHEERCKEGQRAHDQ